MKHIMVVDDSPEIRRLGEATLTRVGLRVSCAESSADALALLDREQFDLLVVDVVMPGTDGFGFLSALGQKYPTHAPVIMLTGKKSREDVIKAVKLGAVDFICKPFDRDLLISKVQSILGVGAVHEDVRFARCVLDQPAEIILGAQLLSLSETGIVLGSGHTFAVGTMMKVNSPFFDLLDVKPPALRVIQSLPTSESIVPYHLILQFVGLGEEELAKLRQYIIQMNLKRRNIKD